MFRKVQLITLFAFSILVCRVAAQPVNPSNVGSVKGLLQDTVHKYTVKAATIALYRSDSTLVNYMLSNNYGEFTFRNLAIDQSYYLEISHVSYQLLRKSFSLNSSNKAVDLKVLILKPREISLKEVSVSLPPISMNGDTLEFNPSAFKLDKNAVVEDLLRKIPNVTLWGDGQITVNGREVKSLLVNGKEFFGGDFKVATQNIPKNALEKVQVYNTQANNQSNPLDSSLTVNLKLKKKKDSGYFGKVGGGYGTTDRYEADGNLNFFSPKTQLGIIGAGNNTNKTARSVSSFISNSTYRGTGINVEYQPDFRAAGISNTNTAGLTFTHNFIEKPTYNNRKVVVANYFLQDRDNLSSSNSETVTTTGQNQKIYSYGTSVNNNLNTNHNIQSQYNWNNRNQRLNVNQNFSIGEGESVNRNDRSAADENKVPTSTNNSSSQNSYSNKSLNLSADYNYSNYRAKIRDYSLRYTLNVTEGDNNSIDLTEFRSFVDPSENKDYNRQYNNHNNRLFHSLVTELPGLNRLVFGKKRLAGIDLSLNNTVDMTATRHKTMVGDFDISSESYDKNAYLSNEMRVSIVNEQPALTVRKNFNKSLSNRFHRNLNFSISAKGNFVNQQSQSDKLFQNLNRSYNRFIPAASVGYNRYQYNQYYNNLAVDFNTSIGIPDIDRLAPLTDSSNVYSLTRGNPNLKSSVGRNLSARFSHTDQRGQNTLNYNFSAAMSVISDSFADSSYVAADNRRVRYTTNIDGQRSLSFNGEVRKALKLKVHAFQFSAWGSLNYRRSPGYVNEVFNFSHTANTSTTFSMNYTYKGKFAIESRQSLNYSRSRQGGFNTSYTGSNKSTAVSASYNITRKFSLNSNINMNTTKSGSMAPAKFNIWNASAVCRMLKADNVEFKITALDLLRENSSVFNSSDPDGFTFSRRNVLQQYFMTTLSYYPRQFKKNAAAK